MDNQEKLSRLRQNLARLILNDDCTDAIEEVLAQIRELEDETNIEVTEEETIKHAAVKSEAGWIFIGKCHADCFHKAHHIKIKMSQKADDQGFITSRGRYVFRGEAAKIAFKSGQTLDDKKILFSEDLWSRHEESNGRYDHDEITGYYLRKV